MSDLEIVKAIHLVAAAVWTGGLIVLAFSVTAIRSATEDTDYVGISSPLTLTFTPGDTEEDIVITITPDDVDETAFDPETFFVNLSNRLDNAVAESFFSTLEHERLSRRIYTTRVEARQDVARWIDDFYNRRRKHSTNGMKSPIDYETEHRNLESETAEAA